MAYDTHLADRVRRIFSEKGVHSTEKKMMGGLAFMVNEKMCVGIIKHDLMARVGPEVYASALAMPGCRPMDFTKRPMKGFVFIGPDGTDLEDDLEKWVQMALDFNPMAKSSKKKKSGRRT